MNPSTFSSARRVAGLVSASAAVLLAACTSMGTGSGSLEPGNTPVTFNWNSKDGGISGNMSAKLADGSSFNGPFLQVTSTTQADSFGPIWSGWSGGWNDWGYWGYGSFPESTFATRYSGKVVANLQGTGNQRLRCRFHLNSPSSGMGGGGQGECQYAGGRTVDAVFPRT